jgi:hypothetical protein
MAEQSGVGGDSALPRPFEPPWAESLERWREA